LSDLTDSRDSWSGYIVALAPFVAGVADAVSAAPSCRITNLYLLRASELTLRRPLLIVFGIPRPPAEARRGHRWLKAFPGLFTSAPLVRKNPQRSFKKLNEPRGASSNFSKFRPRTWSLGILGNSGIVGISYRIIQRPQLSP
jgi:hypothetical protein